MAKVSSGQTAASWDGSGQVWFKIAAFGPTIISSSIDLPAVNMAKVCATIPKSLPSRDYLLRVEQIGLHVASIVAGAQFYISCTQLTVTGGDSGNPSPLVSFLGAYSPTDPRVSSSTSTIPSQPATRFQVQLFGQVEPQTNDNKPLVVIMLVALFHDKTVLARLMKWTEIAL
ncbi:hypothetical protein V500_03141 [Pseudogymnoascus sp. VKM F-4518 (FW-2643)]|nr:hypothetical protein V500_03141 [Pseudogymnoascus sp. VKM F-4518 (FW-2643)]